MMERLVAVVGIVVLIGLAYAWSSDRKAVRWRPVLYGLGLQVFLALVLFRIPPVVALFRSIGDGMTSLLSFANVGATFLFGELAKPERGATFGFQFALTILPIIVFFSSLIAILYHLGVMQRVVRALGWVLERTLRTSPIESLSAAANVFLGQTEAPLLVRHYIPSASVSEIFAIMVGGFATIAGSTMGVYIAMGIPASTLIIASLLAAPGGLALAKLAVPQGTAATVDVQALDPVLPARNLIDAVAHGARDGFMLAVNVLVVLLAFVSVIALGDAGLGAADTWLTSVGLPWLPSSFRELFGWIFLPLAWLMGIPSHEASAVASMLGTKVAMTEFLAYADLARHIEAGSLSPRTVTLTGIALCGFANVASIGIQIGGFGVMAPERRADVARLGFKAMCIGAAANILAACVAGIVMD